MDSGCTLNTHQSHRALGFGLQHEVVQDQAARCPKELGTTRRRQIPYGLELLDETLQTVQVVKQSDYSESEVGLVRQVRIITAVTPDDRVPGSRCASDRGSDRGRTRDRGSDRGVPKRPPFAIGKRER